ncbi:alpha-glucosidase-like isoform X1 [Centruroides vittatus]|uniref:alpha-glucosidase-like isoform X1 n=1 Tax=Centruroides vittatus TaxID=120091 RepID=UPI00350FA490
MEEDKNKINSMGDTEVELNEEEAVKEQLTPNDTPKVKYVNKDFPDKNGDAKIDIENIHLNVGMGKEELMKYANEPAWVRARMILFILFWVCWLGMLIGAIVIIVLAPRCAPPPQLEWWQKSVFYHVYVPSFKDGDGDGMGDLKGLTSKLDYFGKLDIDSLLLSPIYQSPMKDNGYDISNYTDIEPKFGTMEDFEMLMSKLKKKDMKVIMDFIPNHSSDQHPWFKESVKGNSVYKDYYIWAGNRTSGPPNNWLSVFGGSAWTFNEERGQYYFHQFSEQQPDLNLRNPLVKEELEAILKFWLDKGVDGFRIDAIPHLFESEELLDEPVNENATVSKDKYDYLDHIYTKSQPEIFIILAEWREILDNYTQTTGNKKILMTEAFDTLNNTLLYYGEEDKPLSNIPFNFKLLELTKESTAKDLLEHLEYWTSSLPDWAWPNWVLGNHDVDRLASRVGEEVLDGIFMATLLNRGTPIIYYGDELGMLNARILPTELKDVVNPDKPRDVCRTPMQWNNSTSAGFSNSTNLWLPIQDDFETVNVENELQTSRSHLNVFRELVKLRSQPAIRFGKVYYLSEKPNMFCMLRIRKGSPGYLIVINMGNNSSTIDFTNSHENLPDSANVEVRSKNLTGRLAESGHSKIKLKDVTLGSKESVVLSFVPKFDN